MAPAEPQRPATASSCWRLGQRHGALGGGQRGSVEAVGELEGDAWRPGEVGGGLERRGTTACGGAAARQRGRGAEEEEERGCQGLNCKL
jgi:hypothetical protein